MSFCHTSEICPFRAKGTFFGFAPDVRLGDLCSGALAEIPVHRPFLDRTDFGHGRILRRYTARGKWRTVAPHEGLYRGCRQTGHVRVCNGLLACAPGELWVSDR